MIERNRRSGKLAVAFFCTVSAGAYATPIQFPSAPLVMPTATTSTVAGTISGIDGSGLPALNRTPTLDAISGTGAPRAISGAGLVNAISGTGLVEAISGTGAPKAISGTGTPRAISGTGLANAISGTGLVNAISGTGLIDAISGTGLVEAISGTGATSLPNDGPSGLELYAPVTAIAGRKITVMGIELDTADSPELDAADIAIGSMVYVEAEIDGTSAVLKGGYVSDETFIAGVTQVMVKGMARNKAAYGLAFLAGVNVDYTAALAFQRLSDSSADVAFFGVMFSDDIVYATDLQIFD